jgi:hypothetical protein
LFGDIEAGGGNGHGSLQSRRTSKVPSVALGSVDVSTQPDEGRDESEHPHVVASGLLIA